MFRDTWNPPLAVVVIGLCMVTASPTQGQPADNPGTPEPLPETVFDGGVIRSGAGASATVGGDVVYRNLVQSGYYFRPFPGYRDYDDIHLEPGRGGALLRYSIAVFAVVAGPGANNPYDVYMALYTDMGGNPNIGLPAEMIPGTECSFVGIPVGSKFTLVCEPAPGVTIPDVLWLAIEVSTDNAGWLIAGDRPTIGWTSWGWILQWDFFYQVWTYIDWFGPCPPICVSFVAEIVVEGYPWACCETGTSECTNVYETECDVSTAVFAQDSLCGDMDPPCSEAGACCDTLTGTCTNSFAGLCDGYLEVFTAGANCEQVDCEEPEGVPTTTQWGMISLCVLLLTGLTIKFARRPVTARSLPR